MRVLLALIFLFAAGWGLSPAMAQGWIMVDTEGAGGAGAQVCGDEPDAPCFRVTCENDSPLHFDIALFGAAAAGLEGDVPVELRVDGRAAALILFTAGTPSDGMTTLAAPYDPRLHGALIDQLRRGSRAELEIRAPSGAIVTPVSLRGSSKALGAVMDTCPVPEVPLDDPASVVLGEIVHACGQLGGSVVMEPGFERREDLDGDGREDVVIDYAAAVCSEMASLYCGSGGCTVGFFLARDEGFERIFDGVIRGYTAKPDGLLALDLHGTACGLYGFEACRKVFRISDDSFALVDEIAGTAAEAAQAADRTMPAPEPAASADAAADPDTGSGNSSDASAAAQPAEVDQAAKAPALPDAPATEPRATDAAAAQSGDATPERDATEAPGAPALEWIADDGTAVLPDQGDTLPDDLAPDAAEDGPAETN